MQNPQISILIMALMTFSCSVAEKPDMSNETSSNTSRQISLQDNENVYWINSLKAKCVGVAPKRCLQIQKGNEFKDNDWKLFYAAIEGFEYEEGYIYKIIVKEDQISSDRIPADASSIKYTLVKVLEKQLDHKIGLHDIWALESIQRKQIKLQDRQQRPQLEINLQKMKIMGNDGCNNFVGDIVNIDSENIVFSTVAATKKACFNMDIPNRFHQNIISVQTYSRKNLRLYLYDNQGNELFAFKKID